MEFLMGFLCGALIVSGMNWHNTREAVVKSAIIQESGFCIEALASGVKFERCYELKERP